MSFFILDSECEKGKVWNDCADCAQTCENMHLQCPPSSCQSAACTCPPNQVIALSSVTLYGSNKVKSVCIVCEMSYILVCWNASYFGKSLEIYLLCSPWRTSCLLHIIWAQVWCPACLHNLFSMVLLVFEIIAGPWSKQYLCSAI